MNESSDTTEIVKKNDTEQDVTKEDIYCILGENLAIRTLLVSILIHTFTPEDRDRLAGVLSQEGARVRPDLEPRIRKSYSLYLSKVRDELVNVEE